MNLNGLGEITDGRSKFGFPGLGKIKCCFEVGEFALGKVSKMCPLGVLIDFTIFGVVSLGNLERFDEVVTP